MYYTSKLKIVEFWRILKIEQILYSCGKKMMHDFGLQHWDNTHFKIFAILCLTAIKNRIYYSCDHDGNYVATFQVRITGTECCFEKLATAPEFEGKGVGTYCLQQIENLALQKGCLRVSCEVYDKSLHAIRFYEKRGYSVCGERATRKYTVLQMQKKLR